jgi:beta-glucosidase
MSAYNLVNGTLASESPRLLTEILRDEWGFEGLVVSDWGAVDEPAAAVDAGLDLEMPGNPLTPPKIVKAVEEGSLEPAALDRAAAKVLQLADRHTALAALPEPQELDSHHDLARRVAAESIVLLKNEGLLPLEAGSSAKLGVVGRLASQPRIQGIGSSQINPTRLQAAWPALEEMGRNKGYAMAHWGGETSEEGLSEVEKASLAEFLDAQDLALVFAGQTASQDAEAWDRSSMSLASTDLETLEAVKASGKPFAVVLVGGAAIEVRPFDEEADAVLMGWLGGQAFGPAVAEVLFGEASPSGRLSETFARAVKDHVSALNFPGGPKEVHYGEGIYVGYRYFQTFDQDVAYPFGHGLSYTTFEYSDASGPGRLPEPQDFEVTVKVRNSGSRRGAEVVQVYARQLEPSIDRPDRQLVAFDKVGLEPGEAARVTLRIEPRSLARFSELHGAWVVDPGAYEILIGSSAADIRATVPLTLESGDVPERVYTADDIIGDIYQDPRGKAVLDFMVSRAGRGPVSLAEEDDFFAAIFRNLPFKKLRNFSGGAIDDQAIAGLLAVINSDLPPEEVVETLQQTMPAPQGGGEEGETP